MKIGAVVLCGGKSRRMGQEKARLTLGGETFLERILGQLDGFDEILISVNGMETKPFLQYPSVADIYPRCGPMGGLHAALSFCRSDALLAVSCDMPFFHRDLARMLCNSVEPGIDAVAPLSADGLCQPLCAVYRKHLWPIFQQQLERGSYKLQDALKSMRVRNVYVTGRLEHYLENINTPEEYQRCCHDWNSGGVEVEGTVQKVN